MPSAEFRSETITQMGEIGQFTRFAQSFYGINASDRAVSTALPRPVTSSFM